MSNITTESLLQWASGASVGVAGWALKYAWGLNRRFIILETLFEVKKGQIDKMEAQQASDGIKLALHDQQITMMSKDLTAINAKLEPIPRIATLLDQLGKDLPKFVPREELEHRFKSLEHIVTEKHSGKHD